MNPVLKRLWVDGAGPAAAQAVIPGTPGQRIYVVNVVIDNGVKPGAFFLVEDCGGKKTRKHGRLEFGPFGGGVLETSDCPIICGTGLSFGYVAEGVGTHSVTVTYFLAG
jgi:hypothetical protein